LFFDPLVVVFVVDKVEVVGVEQQDALVGLLAKEFEVAVLDFFEVVEPDVLFIRAASFLDVAPEVFEVKVEVDEEVGFRHYGGYDGEEAGIEGVFERFEVPAGEDQGFEDKVVGQGGRFEEVGFVEMVFQLLVSVGQEGEFEGEGVAGRVFVEFGQERVLFKLFEDKGGIEF